MKVSYLDSKVSDLEEEKEAFRLKLIKLDGEQTRELLACAAEASEALEEKDRALAFRDKLLEEKESSFAAALADALAEAASGKRAAAVTFGVRSLALVASGSGRRRALGCALSTWRGRLAAEQRARRALASLGLSCRARRAAGSSQLAGRAFATWRREAALGAVLERGAVAKAASEAVAVRRALVRLSSRALAGSFAAWAAACRRAREEALLQVMDGH